MTLLRTMLIFAGVLFTCQAFAVVEGDSLRLEEREDGTFIIHRVESGETLFSLARRYGSDLSKIAEINKLDGYAINIGQILEIPHSTASKENEAVDGTFHTVKKGETLYAISHIYGANIYDLKKWNKLKSNDIKEGQQLIVAKSKAGKGQTEHVKNANKNNNQTSQVKVDAGKTHKVQPGETLYSISRKYGITVAQLKNLNNLTDNSLAVGQVLVIEGASNNNNSDSSAIASVENETTNSTTVEITEVTTGDTETTTDSTNEVEEVDSVSAPVKTKRFGNGETPREPGEFKKVFEKGMAMRIDNSPKTKKYLCLHRTLPIGAIIQVRNLMNNQSIFVRVVGTLPDIGGNENVLIRLSDIAYERLGAIDAKFPVEISYIPE